MLLESLGRRLGFGRVVANEREVGRAEDNGEVDVPEAAGGDEVEEFLVAEGCVFRGAGRGKPILVME